MTLSFTTQRRQVLAAVLIAVFVLAVISVGTYRTLVVPQGRAFDFYTLWHGGRVFWAGENPYSLDTARDIQLAVFGEIRPDTANQQGYAYPAYVSVLLAPFIALPFPLAASIWTAASLLGLAAAAVLTALSLGWKPRPIGLLLLLLGVYAYRYSLIVVVIGQVQVAVWLGLALALYLYRNGQDRWAGLALAVTAFRPEFGLPLALAVAVLSWRVGRKQVALYWLGALVGLTIIALIRRPTWPLDFLDGLRLYSGYAPVLWPPGLFGVWGWLTLAAVLGLAALVLATRRSDLTDPLYICAILVPLLLTLLPQTGSYSLTLALIPVIVALSPPSNTLARSAAILTLLAPWVIWSLSQQSPDLMPVEHLVIPFLSMLALSLSLVSGRGTLSRTAGVQ